MASLAATPLPETARNPLTITVERNRDRVALLWKSLEQRIGNGSLATSWVWTSTWLAAYGDAIDHWFVIAMTGGLPVGMALLTRGVNQRRGPLPVRSIHIGTAGESPGEGVWIEYNRLLVEPEHRAAFLDILTSAPGCRWGTADVLQLDGFDPDELGEATRAIATIQERTCYIAAIDPQTDPIDSFDRETRRKLRNTLRRFTAEFGPVAVEWIDDPHRAEAVFAELIVLHQERWVTAGEPGAFASVRFRAFHDQLIRRLVSEQGVVLVRITAGTQLIGIFYGLVERDVIFHYQWGLTAFADNRLAPGFITGYLVLDEARRRGYREFNWLAGDHRYKKDLSTGARSLIWAEIPLSPWMRTISGLVVARRTLRGLL